MKHLEQLLLVLRIIAPGMLMVVWAGCSFTDHQHGMDGHHDRSSQVTVWDDRFEIFMEHPFIVAKTPAKFITHITDSVLFQPLRKGPVSFVLTSPSGDSTRHNESSPARDGIFIPKLTFPQAGTWAISLIIPVNDNDYIVDLPPLHVYSSQAEAAHAPDPEEMTGISFLKELQWRMPFETEAVQRKRINSQDALAVPDSAILDDNNQPVAFVHISGEMFLKRNLKLGAKEGGFALVLSGLAEGEYVVTKGAFAVAAAERGHTFATVALSEEDLKKFEIGVEKVKAGKIGQHIRAPGEIVINTDQLVHIVPRVSGIAQQVKKNMGDFVEKGEVLAVIESRDLSDIKSAYLASIESLSLAEPYFKREEDLWKKKISSEQDFLDAKKIFVKARIAMNKAKYELSALGFSLEYINNLPSEPPHLFTAYEITAPFNGTIIEKHITLGKVVKEDSDIFVIANLDTVWVDLRIPQKDASLVRKGQKVAISCNYDSIKTEGTIDYVHSLIDEKTRTKLARVVMDNTSGRFLPGIFVNATVQIREAKADIVVNKDAIQDADDIACVFVQNDQGFEARPILIGHSNDMAVEILRGLEPGERIVTKNSFRIKAKMEMAAAGENAGHGHSH